MAPKSVQTSVASSDPFSDSIHTSEDYEYAVGSTLHVGRDASLTLATDSLIVLGVQAQSPSDRYHRLTDV